MSVAIRTGNFRQAGAQRMRREGTWLLLKEEGVWKEFLAPATEYRLACGRAGIPERESVVVGAAQVIAAVRAHELAVEPGEAVAAGWAYLAVMIDGGWGGIGDVRRLGAAGIEGGGKLRQHGERLAWKRGLFCRGVARQVSQAALLRRWHPLPGFDPCAARAIPIRGVRARRQPRLETPKEESNGK